MPTINEIITEVDRVKVNAYSEEDKSKWLSRLDGKISLDILKQAEAVNYTYPNDGDTELIVKHPHDSVYTYWLYAMIDLANHEYGNYANSMAMFNQAYTDYENWYRRNNEPTSAGNFRNLL